MVEPDCGTVPWGEEWEWWCRHTKGGHYHEKRPSGGSWGYPHHCVNVVNVAEYGVWLEPDDYVDGAAFREIAAAKSGEIEQHFPELSSPTR